MCPRRARSFGLLHRIPPLPENREPGALPPELTPPPEEFDQHQVFVPADVAEGMETPEQAQERMRWEQEEYERESYARHYAQTHAPRNQSSPSAAYVRSPESRPSRSASDYSDETVAHLDKRTTPHASPVSHSMQSNAAYVPPLNLPRPSTPSRSSTFNIPRAATPTQSRPFTYHTNGAFVHVRFRT